MRELPPAPLTGWQRVLVQVVGALTGVVLLVLGFLFSLVVLGALLLVGSVFGAWWWWRTRDLRRALQEQRARQTAWRHDLREDAVIIEGEVIEPDASPEDNAPPRLPR